MKKSVISVILLCVFALLASCAGDIPPGGDTPAPDPHNGRFVCEYGSITFNGDGIYAECEFTDAFAALTGLPAGKSEASYVFLFHNEKMRWDKAEYFRLTVDGKSVQFPNAVGVTSPECIAFRLDNGETVKFIKENK